MILLILYYLVEVFWFLHLGRIVVEMIASFSRSWTPKGVLAVVLEWLFTITDPPVKALRRLIPPLQMGGVALDVSVLVLFVLLSILTMILQMIFLT